VSFVRLALNPAVLSYQPRSETALLNWYLYSYGIVIAALFVAGRLLAPPRNKMANLNVDLPSALGAMGTILLFILMNIQIADFYTRPGESTLVFQFSGNFARDMTYTIAWSVFALGLVVAGIRIRLAPCRYAGLALMGLAVAKLLIHDLERLKQLYRIGALAAVAVIAILFGLLYQRFMSGPPEAPADPTQKKDES
ncbi:MAG: DUF2339 domain-containing protein, partial [Verrucomicrobia bacterium]|nr:DUF2339 domain-containing protein [Verrucomicrobiota bacterium]